MKMTAVLLLLNTERRKTKKKLKQKKYISTVISKLETIMAGRITNDVTHCVLLCSYPIMAE